MKLGQLLIESTHNPFKHLIGEYDGQLAISQLVVLRLTHYPLAHL